MGERIVLDHGGGGRRTRDLIRELFQTRLGNSRLDAETDAALVAIPSHGGSHAIVAGDPGSATTTPGGASDPGGSTTTPGGTSDPGGATTTPGGASGPGGATTTPGGASGPGGATTTTGGASDPGGGSSTTGGASDPGGPTNTPGGTSGPRGPTTSPGGASNPGGSITPGGASDPGSPTIAVTTDAHVVKPLFFPGGDIGRLAVCGTVNDLAVSGANPRYLTSSFIIEEGFALSDLESIVDSMAAAAAEAGVEVVAGDTKVVERGACDGLFITTSGVGEVPVERREIAGGSRVAGGDRILVSGPVGDHGAAIVCARNKISTDPPLVSDCAPLTDLIRALYHSGIVPHFMRDATRGGLATVLCELAEMRSIGVEIEERELPVRDTVRGVCELYGFDPLYLANEGTMVCLVDEAQAPAALAAMRAHPLGGSAAIIGKVPATNLDQGGGPARRAVLRTIVGGSRLLRMLSGEQLPRIC